MGTKALYLPLLPLLVPVLPALSIVPASSMDKPRRRFACAWLPDEGVIKLILPDGSEQMSCGALASLPLKQEQLIKLRRPGCLSGRPLALRPHLAMGLPFSFSYNKYRPGKSFD